MTLGEPVPAQGGTVWRRSSRRLGFFGRDVRHGLCFPGGGLCLGVGTTPPRILVQFLCDDDCHHHSASDDDRAHNDLGCRKDAEPHSHDSRTRRGERAFSRHILKPDLLIVESMKASPRQDGPCVGCLSHHALPVIRPGVLRRPLKAGDPRVGGAPRHPGSAPSWRRPRAGAGAGVRGEFGNAWPRPFNQARCCGSRLRRFSSGACLAVVRRRRRVPWVSQPSPLAASASSSTPASPLPLAPAVAHRPASTVPRRTSPRGEMR
jgi:hypothetical protein